MPDDTVQIPEMLGEMQAPPRKVIKDAASALGIATKLDTDDMLASLNRQAIDALLDGQQPYDPAAREAQGLGHLANFNMGGARAKEQNALAAYIDLTDAVETPANFEVDSGDVDVNDYVSSVLADEFDYLHDTWKGYRPTMLRLATQFIRHGVSAVYWDNEWDWRWDAAGLMDFKLERGTHVGDENIKMAKFFDSMTVDELWEKIEDEQAGEAMGWKVEEVKKAIAGADTTASASNAWYKAWDRFQQYVKENAYYLRTTYAKVYVHKLIVREYDGTYSLYIINANGGDDFLCKRERYYGDIGELLVTFTYGVGDGMYHTIRGLGFQMFYAEQALNRSWCNLIDGTDLAGKIVFQPTDPNELESMSISNVGPYSIINVRGTFPNVASPNVNSQVMPVIQLLQKELEANTGQYRAVPVGESDTKGVTATEFRGRTVDQTVLGSAAMTLFYDPLERVFNEEFRRLINPALRQSDPGGKQAFNFRARVIKKLSRRNIPWEVVNDVRRVRPNRAMGNGSPQLRQNAAQQLLAVSGYFDEPGKNKAVRAYTATIPGVSWMHVDEYAPLNGPRIPQDANIAAAQNAAFGSGVPQPVLNTDNQAVHCQVHGDFLYSIAEALDGNQIDPQRGMAILNEGITHLVGQDGQPGQLTLLDEDKGHQPEAAATRKLVQNVSAVYERWQNHLAAQARKQQQDQANQQGQPQQPQGPDPADVQKLQFEQEKHQQDLQHKAETHQQQLQQSADKAKQDLEFNGKIFRFRQQENAEHLHVKDLEAAQRIGQQSLSTLIKTQNGNGASQ